MQPIVINFQKTNSKLKFFQIHSLLHEVPEPRELSIDGGTSSSIRQKETRNLEIVVDIRHRRTKVVDVRSTRNDVGFRRAKHQILRRRSLGVAQSPDLSLRKLRVRILHGRGAELRRRDDDSAKTRLRDHAERVGGDHGTFVGNDCQALSQNSQEGHRSNGSTLQKEKTGKTNIFLFERNQTKHTDSLIGDFIF